MCGIAGIYYFDPNRRVSPEALSRMAKAIEHRGPDDEGFYMQAGIGLAHRRLSIIDLAGGKQPLCNESKDIWVVFNGEIFNYQELRPDLEKRGHQFATQSDTEVIVHLYEEYGQDCVKHLRGQFAIAIWDEKKRALFLARDRMGQKPLYYYRDQECFLFASEMKAVFAYGELSLALDHSILGHYLDYGFISYPRTQFKEIRKLEPGQSLFLQDGRESFKRYWEMPFPEANGQALSFADAISELETKLMEATRLRLISDVPLGAFLSGGLDSSLIVAMMAKLHSGPVKTFNIAFRESSYDESPYAKQVAKHLKTDHHEIPVDYRVEDLIEKILHHFDEPFADSSAIPQYFVSQAARQFVKVALSGDAGDEIFFGYRRYLGRKLVGYYNHLPQSLKEMIYRGVKASVKESHAHISKSPSKMLGRFLESVKLYDQNPASSWLPLFTQQEIQSLLGQEVYSIQDRENPLAEFFANHVGKNPVAQTAYADQKSYFPDDILVKVDRMSMFHGLEVRSPLLDHQLVEWAAKLPISMKLHGLKGKYILRKLAEKYLPQEVIDRRKQGFAVPIPHWFRNELKDLVRDRLLTNSSMLFNREFVQKILEEHQSGKKDYAQQLWALLSLQATFRNPSCPSR